MTSQRTLKMFTLTLLLAGTFLMSSCGPPVEQYTLLSTRNYDVSAKYIKVGNFEASDRLTQILFFTIGQAHVENAIDSCLSLGGGEFLTDATVSISVGQYFLVNTFTITCRGDVWKKANISDLMNPNIEKFSFNKGISGVNHFVSEIDNNRKFAILDKKRATIDGFTSTQE
jgi:hypothetical protein